MAKAKELIEQRKRNLQFSKKGKKYEGMHQNDELRHVFMAMKKGRKELGRSLQLNKRVFLNDTPMEFEEHGLS